MIIDIIIVLMLVMFTIGGLKKGIIKSGISLIGLVIVYLISFSFKGVIGDVLCRYLPFFNLEGNYNGLTSINILIYQLIGFFIIFSLLLTIYYMILKLANIVDLAANATIILIIPLKILGAIFGFIGGYIVLFICIVVLMVPLHDVEFFTSSKLVNHIAYKSPLLTKYVSPVIDVIEESCELGENIGNNKITKKEANEKILDIMIENKIVDKKLVDELIDSGKLKM